MLYAYWIKTKYITKILISVWDRWVVKMSSLFSAPIIRQQLQSRKTQMNEMWHTWKYLKAKTGLGWDAEKNCVTGDAHT